MSSLFGTGVAAFGGAAPRSAVGLVAATSGEGNAGSVFASSNVGDGIPVRNSSTTAAAAASGGGIFSSTSGNQGSGAVLTCTNSTDGRIPAFGPDGNSTHLPSGLKSSSVLQGISKGENRAGSSCFVGGSLFGSTGGNAAVATGDSSTPALTGQGASTPNPPSAGGSLFGSAAGKSCSLLSTGSVLSATVTAGTAAPAASPHSSVAGSEPPFNTSSSTSASGVSTSCFSTAQGAQGGQAASAARLFGNVGDHGRQAANNSSDSPPQGGSSVVSTGNSVQSSAALSATFSAAAESRTGSLSAARGGLFGTTARVPTTSSSGGPSDTKKTPNGDAQSGASTSARLPDARDDFSTMAAGGVNGASVPSSAASRGPGSGDGGLFGKPGLSSASSSVAETNVVKGGQCVPSTSALIPAANSASKASTVPGAAADGLPPPREVALETLQHELLEEVLARWERRLARRVEQFTAVAEEVESVEKAMIEESRKIQQVMNEQGKLERKQVYTAGVIDSLEHQQRDLMRLLRSIEGAVFELRCGGPKEIRLPAKNTSAFGSCSADTAVAVTRDAGVGFRLLKADGQEESRPAAALDESGSGTRFPERSFTDHNEAVASMPLLSSAEQLALERLRGFDQQLAEVGQSLSYTAEAFQAGSLGAVAQVLAVHQAALRAAAHQAAHIGEHMRQLQEAWEVSKGRSDSRGGLPKQSG